MSTSLIPIQSPSAEPPLSLTQALEQEVPSIEDLQGVVEKLRAALAAVRKEEEKKEQDAAGGREVSEPMLLLPAAAGPVPLDPRLLELRQMALDSVVSANSKRNYGKALDHMFAFAAGRPLTRALLLQWRGGMDKLSPSTVNVRLSAMRRLVAEARRKGLVGVEGAASMTEVPDIRQKGTRLGNCLTRQQAKELLAVRDRSTIKGKRDYAILALLVGCALRRRELAKLLKTFSCVRTAG